jgi:membrane protein
VTAPPRGDPRGERRARSPLAEFRLRARLLVALLGEAFSEFQDDDATRHGAALAYYTLVSAAPLLVVTTAVAGLLYRASDVQVRVATRLEELLGPTGAHTVQELLANAVPPRTGTVSAIVGIVLLLFGATSVFVQLRGTLNHIWDVPPRRHAGVVHGFVREQLRGVAMVLVVGAGLLASLVADTLRSALTDAIGGPIAAVLAVFGPLTGLALATALFAVLFRGLPDRRIPWADVWVGALVTAALFTAGRAAIAAYLTTVGAASAPGAASAVLALLTWVYYSALILIFGAELTQVYARRTGSCQKEAELLEKGRKRGRA